MNEQLNDVEIASTADRAKRRGEYDAALSSEATIEADAIGRMLTEASELDDAQVAELVASLEPELNSDADVLQREVMAALEVSLNASQ